MLWVIDWLSVRKNIYCKFDLVYYYFCFDHSSALPGLIGLISDGGGAVDIPLSIEVNYICVGHSTKKLWLIDWQSLSRKKCAQRNLSRTTSDWCCGSEFDQNALKIGIMHYQYLYSLHKKNQPSSYDRKIFISCLRTVQISVDHTALYNNLCSKRTFIFGYTVETS